MNRWKWPVPGSFVPALAILMPSIAKDNWRVIDGVVNSLTACSGIGFNLFI